jgi:hypothetical protein
VRKEYEFDIGVHYVGDVSSQTLTKTLCDQITDGQLEWATLDDAYDVISVGYGGEEEKRYKEAYHSAYNFLRKVVRFFLIAV